MPGRSGPPESETSVVDLGPAGSGAAHDSGSLCTLVTTLFATTRAVAVHRVAPSTYVAYLPGPRGRSGASLRAVGAEPLTYADRVVRALETAVLAHGDAPALALLVAYGEGGAAALDVAAMAESEVFDVDRIVTVGAPAALVPRVPTRARMLSLEERTDLGALLGSLVNADSGNRLTVVFDGTGTTTPAERYVAGARLADTSDHPEVIRAIADLRALGYVD